MFNVGVKDLALPEPKTIEFDRFVDHRGFFTEPFRKEHISDLKELAFYKDLEIVQVNESLSKKGVVRGMHFQWDPYVHKMFRPLYGEVIAICVDARIGSPNYGKALLINLKTNHEDKRTQMLYSPPGFALGFLVLEDSFVQYFLTGNHRDEVEVQLSPIADDIDWSLCDKDLKDQYLRTATTTEWISEKDKAAMNLTSWLEDERNEHFSYNSLRND